MNTRSGCKTASAIAIVLSARPVAFPRTDAASNDANRAAIRIAPAKPGGKELLIPARVSRVPATNDFNSPDSEFNFERSKASDHFVLFWAKEYGDDPMTNSRANRRSNVSEGGRGRRAPAAPSDNERWPYKFKLTGRAPDDSVIH